MEKTGESRNVTVIGLGLMGSALAENFLKADHAVTVWNRSLAKTEPFADKGARVATSPSDAILASDVAVVCVPDHATTLALLEDLESPVEGKTLVQVSTMTSQESNELAIWAASQGLGYLEASIFGIPTSVLAGQATLIYAGPKTLFDTHEPLLTALSPAKYLSPDYGAAVTFDRVWYAYGFAVSMAFMQGAAMAHAQGFSLDVFFDMVKVRSPIIIEQCLNLGQKIAVRHYETSDARLNVWADCFEGSLAICRDMGVDDSLPSAVMKNFKRAQAAGWADSDLAAVFEVLVDPENKG